MRIAIDTREAMSPRPTGKGVWAANVLRELHGREIGGIEEYAGKGGLLWQLQTAHALRLSKPDLFLSPTSFIIPWLLGKSVKTAVVIHDLIAFDVEPHDRKAQAIERATLSHVLKTARYIFCVSESTKNELLERFPRTDQSKITVVYEGPTVDRHASSPPVLSEVEGLSMTRPFILSIGTLCPRKNQLRLIQAFNALPDSLKSRTKLILAGGRGWKDEKIIKLAKKSANVEWRGYVPDDELESLLRNATILAYPSLKEGFGLPVLDALTLGVPVLTSNRSSMKEIAGDAALLVDPTSVDEIRNGLAELLINSSLRQSLIERGLKRAGVFSWKQTVDLMLDAIK